MQFLLGAVVFFFGVMVGASLILATINKIDEKEARWDE